MPCAWGCCVLLCVAWCCLAWGGVAWHDIIWCVVGVVVERGLVVSVLRVRLHIVGAVLRVGFLVWRRWWSLWFRRHWRPHCVCSCCCRGPLLLLFSWMPPRPRPAPRPPPLPACPSDACLAPRCVARSPTPAAASVVGVTTVDAQRQTSRLCQGCQ